METEKSCKEKFEKEIEKAHQNKEKYDYFGIAQNKTKAFLNNSEVSKIKNAFIILKRLEELEEWEVENFKVKKCPKSLHVCIKNLKVLLGCAGEHDREESFFQLKIKKEAIEEKDTQDIAIFGVVEVNECVSMFYYNCAIMESWYINCPSYQTGDTELFKLAEGLRYMEGLLNEQRERAVEGLERKAEVSKGDWQWA